MEKCPYIINNVTRCFALLNSRDRSPDGFSTCFKGHKTKNTDWKDDEPEVTHTTGYVHVMQYENEMPLWVKNFLISKLKEEIVNKSAEKGDSVEAIITNAKQVLGLVNAIKTIELLKETNES